MTEDIHWKRFRKTVYITTASAIIGFLIIFTLMHGWQTEDSRQRLLIHTAASWAATAATFATMAVFAYKFECNDKNYSWLVGPATLVALTVLCWIVGFHNLAANQAHTSLNQAIMLIGAIALQLVAAIVISETSRVLSFSRVKMITLLFIEVILIAGSLILPIVHTLVHPLVS